MECVGVDTLVLFGADIHGPTGIGWGFDERGFVGAERTGKGLVRGKDLSGG